VVDSQAREGDAFSAMKSPILLPSILLAAALILAACSSLRPEPRRGAISIDTSGVGGPDIQIGGIDNDDETPVSVSID
jgi:hypothetical protein